MAEGTKSDKISLEELMVSTLAMADALAKLMIAKDIITDEEFKGAAKYGASELSSRSKAPSVARVLLSS